MTAEPRPLRLAIVRLSHLGDVVHALPVYHALRARHPRAELGWIVQEEFAPLVAPLPGIARVFAFGRRAGFGAWLRLRRDLLEWSPDQVVDAQGNVKSAMASLISGAARRSGLAWSDWTERFAAHVATERAAAAEGPHAIDRMLALARHLAPSVEPRFDPVASPDELEAGRRRCRQLLGPEGGAGEWILALSRPGDPRSWPEDNIEALARHLVQSGGRVLLLSGPAETELGVRLAQRLEALAGAGVSHWIGQRGLRELVGFFSAASERGARLVACDSGPMHLAAACGLAVRLLAGPQDPARTGPWPQAELVRAGAGATSGAGDHHRAFVDASAPACAPCKRPRCSHPSGPVCMERLAPEGVAAVLLAETSREPFRLPRRGP